MNKKILLAIIGTVLLAILYWLSTHAFIEVLVENPAVNNEISYSFRGNSAEKPTIKTTKSTKVRKLVSRGTHEVLIKQNESSYFTVVKTSGFLSKTAIGAVLSPERKRSFAGDNPGPCVYFIGGVLASAGCNDSYSNLRLHAPASSSQPTYLQSGSSPITGTIEGLIKLGGTSYILVKAPDADEDQGAPHTLYQVTDNLDLSQGIPLSGLNENTYYSMLAYKDGFIVLSDTFDQVLYYASPTSQASTITVNRPANLELKPYALSVQDQSIVVAYSNNTEEEVADVHDVGTKRVNTVVVVHDGQNNSKQFDFKGSFSSVKSCGSGKLCMLRADKLEVYDLSKKKPRLLFSVSDVAAIENLSGGLVIARKNEVLNLDIESQKGAIDYSLGDYRFCGVKTDDKNYALCLISSRSQKTALLINREAENTDSIDKKIAGLLPMSEISNVSVYGNYIFISPALGELIFSEATGGYGYDETLKREVNAKIDRKIDALGIDRKSYTVINTLP